MKSPLNLVVKLWLASFVSVALSPVSASPEDKPELPTVGGRVVNSQHEGMRDVLVKLLDQKGDVVESGRTAADGTFALEHKPLGSCILEIIPARESAMATALVENVPGERDRRFVIELHRGVHVAGKVVGAGHPLKGLLVKAVPIHSQQQHTDIHGGGFDTTARDGSFRLTLTPGGKRIEVFNQRYPGLAEHFGADINVTAPVTLSDIVVPAKNESERR